ncbi:MAG: glycosyltransferase [Gemmatimonadetes bacterium]|nr:glycosyltransferase [Gemmatimonadota bacterium]
MTSHPHRATIAPVPAGADRPRWSVMIPTYHCAAYLAKTLESVLQQDPGPAAMQIEVVDDCSSQDDPEAVVRAVGGGRVGFFRQERNGGHVHNFATCLARSRGQLVHLLHGDDYVQPGFYRAMGAAFTAQPDIGLATCRHLYAHADGHWFGISRLRQPTRGLWEAALRELVLHGDLQTPSVVVRREVYERLGGFDDRLRCMEDYEMWVRVAAHYPVWYDPECLAVYRFHQGSNTARDSATAENIRDARRAVDVIAENNLSGLPAGWRRFVLRRNARQAIERAGTFLDRGRFRSALVTLREGLRLDAGVPVVLRALRCPVTALLRLGRRLLRGA